jgi:hypothetical protein
MLKLIGSLFVISSLCVGCAAEDNGLFEPVSQSSSTVTLRRIEGTPSPEALPTCILLENHWYCYDVLKHTRTL